MFNGWLSKFGDSFGCVHSPPLNHWPPYRCRSLSASSRVAIQVSPAVLRAGLPAACRSLRPLDSAHISTINAGHLSIVPSDRDSIPTGFGDLAAVIGFAMPTDAVANLEVFRLGGCHCSPLSLPPFDADALSAFAFFSAAF